MKLSLLFEEALQLALAAHMDIDALDRVVTVVKEGRIVYQR